MATAEEFLRADVGGLIAQLLFQTAVLKAENAALKERLGGDGTSVIASNATANAAGR